MEARAAFYKSFGNRIPAPPNETGCHSMSSVNLHWRLVVKELARH
jgi:hypothetical protein